MGFRLIANALVKLPLKQSHKIGFAVSTAYVRKKDRLLYNLGNDYDRGRVCFPYNIWRSLSRLK